MTKGGLGIGARAELGAWGANAPKMGSLPAPPKPGPRPPAATAEIRPRSSTTAEFPTRPTATTAEATATAATATEAAATAPSSSTKSAAKHAIGNGKECRGQQNCECGESFHASILMTPAAEVAVS